MIEPKLLIILGMGIFLIILLVMLFFFTYIEEKKRCVHIWEETNRDIWRDMITHGEFIKVELKCKKCGEVTNRRL